MATMPSTGALSFSNLQTVMGGANPISLSEYYRNGTYVPSTKSVTVQEPSSGEYYSPGSYSWYDSFNSKSGLSTYFIYWAGSLVGNFSSSQGWTSYTSGSTTYYRGSSQGASYYGIYRTTLSTVNINTNVPTSGTISMSQFYGAEKP